MMFVNVKYLLFRVILLLLSTSTVQQTDSGRSTQPVTKFAFGGALYVQTNDTAQNDPQLITAAKFAMNKMYAHTTNGQEESDFSITSATISKLLYSEDSQTPFMARVVDPDTGQPMLYPLIWGVLYSLNLSAPHNDGHSMQHSLVIFQFWDGLLYLFQHTFQQQLTMPLRNIGGDAEYIRRIRHLAALCRETDADVIGLQEVRFEESQGGSLGPNQMAHLAELLPDYQYVFQPAQVQTHTLPNMSIEGVAFLSKHPITSHDFLFLKMDLRDPADGRQRILQHVEVSLPVVGKVHIFNTHLSLSHKARATSVLQTWDYINTFPGPAFLMGDWNAEPHNVEVQFLDGRSSLRGSRTTGLYDVWRLKHGLDAKGFTFSSIHKRLTKRIDIIFMREHKRVSLEDVWKLDDKTRREKAASDHLGLVAEFMIRE